MKKIGCMATYEKRANTRQKAIDSIQPQLDEFWLMDNSSTDLDRADNAKFHALDHIDEPCFMFLLDDDLTYPPDYVEKMIISIQKFDCIITLHGRLLLGEGLNYYKAHKSFHCLGTVPESQVIDVAGTGVTAFDTRYFHPKGLASDPRLRMSDLLFSLEAAKQQKTIGVLKHKAGWIKHINNKETIFDTESKDCRIQNEIADKIFKLNYD